MFSRDSGWLSYRTLAFVSGIAEMETLRAAKMRSSPHRRHMRAHTNCLPLTIRTSLLAYCKQFSDVIYRIPLHGLYRSDR